MANVFNKIAVPRIGYNQFDLSHEIKTSFNMGFLIPTMVTDVLPGDIFNFSCENLLRFSPLNTPVMHRVYVTSDFYFVPDRILWPEMPDWLAGNSDPSVVPPYILGFNGAQEGDLADYLGYPTDVQTINLQASALPVAAYLKIYNDYYRDENLQGETFQELTAGDNSGFYAGPAFSPPLKRAWMHDYFTSCLPWPQKGDAVTIPLLNAATTDVTLKSTTGTPNLVRNATSHAAANWDVSAVGATTTGETNNAGTLSVLDPNGAWEVDINSQAQDIAALRLAFAAQEWQERNARGGTRYKEFLKAHFDVDGGDPRLDRPEFIGRYTQRMVISEVLSTAQDVANEVPIGALKGHGISAGQSKRLKYRAKEHGWIIGLINVQPVTAYQQGLPRMYSRTDKFDYFFSTLQHVGEQAVLRQEIWCVTGGVPDLETEFGYIPRYAEYKYINSRVCGEFKTTLDDWHLGRIFTAIPLLNSSFIECSPSRRIFDVTDPNVDTIYAQIFISCTGTRKIAKYGVPMI